MAIAFGRTESIRRGSKNGNVVAAAAYVLRENMADEFGGRHDHRARLKTEPAISLGTNFPGGKRPDGVTDEAVWRMAQGVEKRRDAQEGRRQVWALPRELEGDHEAMRRCAMAVVEHWTEKGYVCAAAIHLQEGKPHLQIVASSRKWDGEGFEVKKDRELSQKGPASDMLNESRRRWQEACNRELAAAGHGARIDMRSYAAQGSDKEALEHESYGSRKMAERRGIPTERMARNAGRIARREQTEAEEEARRLRDAAGSVTAQAAGKIAEAERLESFPKPPTGPSPSNPVPEAKKARAGASAASAKPLADSADMPKPRIEKNPAEGERERRKDVEHTRTAIDIVGRFVRGECDEREMSENLRRHTKDRPINHRIVDDSGNTFAHLMQAAHRRMVAETSENRAMTMEALGKMQEARDTLSTVAAEAGRIDMKTRNTDGQTPGDVGKEGLRKPPGKPKDKGENAGGAKPQQAGATSMLGPVGKGGGAVGTAAPGRAPAMVTAIGSSTVGKTAGRRIERPKPLPRLANRTQGQQQQVEPRRTMGQFQMYAAQGQANAAMSAGAWGCGSASQTPTFTAAGGAQPPPPGLSPREYEAWMHWYKEKCQAAMNPVAKPRPRF